MLPMIGIADTGWKYAAAAKRPAATNVQLGLTSVEPNRERVCRHGALQQRLQALGEVLQIRCALEVSRQLVRGAVDRQVASSRHRVLRDARGRDRADQLNRLTRDRENTPD